MQKKSLALIVLLAALAFGSECKTQDDGYDPTKLPTSKCGICSGTKPICDESTNQCVECLATTDCKDATKALCDNTLKACVACTQDTECSHIANTGMCSAGRCVQCTSETEEQKCGENVCDIQKGICSTYKAESAELCYPCVSDRQCKPGSKCVENIFKGQPRGGYCWRLKSSGACTNDQYLAELKRKTLSDPTKEVDFCAFDETLTTCEAVRMYNQQCVGTPSPVACAITEGDDGKCVASGSLKNRCSYACTSDTQCRPGILCNLFCGQ